MFFSTLSTYLLVCYLIICVLALIVFIKRCLNRKRVQVKAKTVVITGGSSGVGLALAQECLNRGASKVALIARNVDGLNRAIKSLRINDGQEVKGFSADVSEHESIANAFKEIEGNFFDKIDFLFVNAGAAMPQMLKDIDIDVLGKQCDVNLKGAMLTTKAALNMLSKDAHINYSGSICSILTFSGYSGYGTAKTGLRGLSDTMRNEFCHTDIKVHFSIISSVDTPGYKVECLKKPEACKRIEGTASLFKPEQIAKLIFDGIDRGDYYITMEFLSWIMLELGYGITPTNNIFLQMVVSPFLPIIRKGALIYIDCLAKHSDPLEKEKNE